MSSEITINKKERLTSIKEAKKLSKLQASNPNNNVIKEQIARKLTQGFVTFKRKLDKKVVTYKLSDKSIGSNAKVLVRH